MTSPLGAVEMVVGLVLIILTFYDVFQSVVLPRPAVRRTQLPRYIVRPLWYVWRWIFNRGTHLDRTEARLAAFGPLVLITLFLIWAFALILGYSLIIDSLGGQFQPRLADWPTSFYVSATTLVPLSYGDFVPEQGVARLVIIIESATGVAFAAVAITLLFEFYNNFREREEEVVALDAIAGAPPSAIQLLETAAFHPMDGELSKTFDDWKSWSAKVLESHLAYPILIYFRSSHDNEAWVNSHAAVMDAAALILSSTDDRSKGAAKLMFTVGHHLVEDMAWVFNMKVADGPIIERSEYQAAIERMRAAGYSIKDGDASWNQFASYRGKYASVLNQIAQLLVAPPAQWVGDRSYLPHRQRRRRTRPATTRTATSA